MGEKFVLHVTCVGGQVALHVTCVGRKVVLYVNMCGWTGGSQCKHVWVGRWFSM